MKSQWKEYSYPPPSLHCTFFYLLASPSLCSLIFFFYFPIFAYPIFFLYHLQSPSTPGFFLFFSSTRSKLPLHHHYHLTPQFFLILTLNNSTKCSQHVHTCTLDLISSSSKFAVVNIFKVFFHKQTLCHFYQTMAMPLTLIVTLHNNSNITKVFDNISYCKGA